VAHKGDALVSSDFGFDVVHGEDEHVLVLHGQLDLAHAARVRQALRTARAATVVADLSDLTFLDSSGIAALLAARSELLAGGRRFELRGAQGIVRQVLEVTGLAFLLDAGAGEPGEAPGPADGASGGLPGPEG
jgi:anti-anti-sigma factor